MTTPMMTMMNRRVVGDVSRLNVPLMDDLMLMMKTLVCCHLRFCNAFWLCHFVTCFGFAVRIRLLDIQFKDYPTGQLPGRLSVIEMVVVIAAQYSDAIQLPDHLKIGPRSTSQILD